MPAKRKGGKYGPHMLQMARKLGKEGFCIVEASQKMGISPAAFRLWECEKPAFRKAASKIRENSDKWKALRFERLLKRNEAQLLAALERVREKRAAQIRKYTARFGPDNSA